MVKEQEIYDSIEFRGEDGWIGNNLLEHNIGDGFILTLDFDSTPSVIDTENRDKDQSETIDDLLSDQLPKLRVGGVERSSREDHLYYLHIVECDGRKIEFED